MFKSEPKRLVIKGFKGPRLPEDFESSCWDTIKQGLMAILNGHTPAHGYEAIYRAAEAMVRANLGRELHGKLGQELTQHIQRHLQPQLERALRSGSTMSRDGLEDVLMLWTEFKGQLRVISRLLLYLERVWAAENRQPTVEELGISLFRNLLLTDEVTQRLVQGLRALMEKERLTLVLQHMDTEAVVDMSTAMEIDQPALKAAEPLVALMALFRETGLFTNLAEPLLLRQAEGVYQGMTLPQLPSQLLALAGRENALLQALALPPSCHHLIMQRVEQSVLVRGLETVLFPSFAVLMNNGHETEALYRLAQSVNRLDQLRAAWSTWIKAEGATRNGSIEALLELRERLEKILHTGWHDDQAFEHALQDAFETAINGAGSRVAELLSLHLDALLTKETGPQILARLMTLFRHLQGKENFEQLHRSLLARRLIAGTFNRPSEMAFIKLLREECGAAYVSRMETMFKDLEASQQMMRAWRGRTGGHDDKRRRLVEGSVPVQILVANSGLWPHPPLEENPPAIPSSVQTQLESFAGYYGEQYEGRRLQWHHGLGLVELKRSDAGNNPQELLATVPQALILLHLSEVAAATESELNSVIGMPAVMMLNQLVKIGLVCKSEQGYSMNPKFTSKHARLRLTGSSGDETSLASPAMEITALDTTLHQMRQDRQAQLDATIVRLAKRAKKISETDLLAQVEEHLSKLGHQPGVEEMTIRLQSLIERDYIARDANDSSQLVYLA